MKKTLALLVLVAAVVPPIASRVANAALSSGCDLYPGGAGVEQRCDIYSTDPDGDADYVESIGVSVYAFYAPTWSAYPSGWTDASIYNVAFQSGSGECVIGYYAISYVQFRYTENGAGSPTPIGSPTAYGPLYYDCQ